MHWEWSTLDTALVFKSKTSIQKNSKVSKISLWNWVWTSKNFQNSNFWYHNLKSLNEKCESICLGHIRWLKTNSRSLLQAVGINWPEKRMEAESSKDGKQLAPPRPLLFPLAVVASLGTAEESIVSQIMFNTKWGLINRTHTARLYSDIVICTTVYGFLVK